MMLDTRLSMLVGHNMNIHKYASESELQGQHMTSVDLSENI